MNDSRIINCNVKDCSAKVQAACFSCYKLMCFKCSMSHGQAKSTHKHIILQLQESMQQMRNLLNNYEHQAHEILNEGQKLSCRLQKHPNENVKLNPQRFQQQLDEINFIKKQTLKVVEKFFSEISLEIVNIWEQYLKKYSSYDETKEKITSLCQNIKYCSQQSYKKCKIQNTLKAFFNQGFEEQLSFCRKKVQQFHQNSKDVPKCPQVKIDQRVLVQLSQVLCSAISTINYVYDKNKDKTNIINISAPNYLLGGVKELPIFPIKKPYCYLFNLERKQYEIQEFNELQHLPDYPKTIIIPNGDIHIIGGVLKENNILNTHLVFRSTSAQVFKLTNLPYPINPSNSLLYHSKIIYLIGGLTDKHQWDTRCLKYSLEHKQWTAISPMNNAKPHQSSSIFNKSIYCFGIPDNKKINIQKYDIAQNYWSQLSIANFLSNPFNFASGFSALQINQQELLLFGGKKFLENAVTKKRSTDRCLSPHLYLFRPENSSFVQIGALNPCLGVQYGEFNPIVHNERVYYCEYLLCKNNPILRWYDVMQMVQVNPDGGIQSITIFNED